MHQPARQRLTQSGSIRGMQILQEIGAGAESIVYLASREDKLYAVKVPRDWSPDSAQADSRFLALCREASVLARIDHPGIAKVLAVEQGHADEPLALVMEYIDGKPLKELLKDGPLSEASLLSLAETIAGALGEVHSLGLVHRDVKPPNILYDKAGVPKLIDFGFAHRANQGPGEGEIAGTFLYAPAEQSGALKRPVDARSDLYALGAVLFECATGRPPFLSTDVAELIRQHVTAPVPSIQKLNPNINPNLEAVIIKLLSKDPDDRYQSAQGLIEDLKMISESVSRGVGKDQFILGAKDEMHFNLRESPLYGRGAELSLLKSKWDSVKGKPSALVLIEGIPGSGKSRLVRELIDYARKDHALVLSAKCGQGDRVPFAPLRNAIDAYLHRIRRLPLQQAEEIEFKIKEVAGEFGPLLKSFTPELSRLLSEREEGERLEQGAEIFNNALVNFLLKLPEISSSPLLFFIDDVQWLDESSLSVLKGLAINRSSASFLIVAAARNDPESENNLTKFVKELGIESTEDRLKLNPLDKKAMANVIQGLLGRAEADFDFTQKIVTKSGGSPFAAGEYLSAILEAGLLRPYWGKWIADPAGIDHLQLPTDVLQLVLKRMDQLEDRTKRVLQAAALLGSHFPLEILPQIRGMTLAEVHAAVLEATQANLIERGELGHYAFVHDRVREAMIASLAPSEVRALHQRIAETLDAAAISEGDADHIYALARHYSSGESEKNPKRVFEALLAAGYKAYETFATEESYQFLKQAYELCSRIQVTPDGRHEEILGRACLITGRTSEGMFHCGRAIEASQDPILRAEIRATSIPVLIHVATSGGKTAFEESKEGFKELGVDPPARSWKLWLISFIEFMVYLPLHRLGIGAGSAKGKKRERLKTLSKIYEANALIDFLNFDMTLVLQGYMRQLKICHLLGPSRESMNLCINASNIAFAFKMKKLTARLTKQSYALARQIGNPRDFAFIALSEAMAYGFGGEETIAERLSSRVLAEYGRVMIMFDGIRVISIIEESLITRGYAVEAFKVQEAFLQRYSKDAQSSFEFSNGMMSLFMLGRPAEGLKYLQGMESRKVEISRVHDAQYFKAYLVYYFETGDLGKAIDDVIEKHESLRISLLFVTYFNRLFYIYAAKTRFAQYHQAGESKEAEIRYRQWVKTIRDLKVIARTSKIVRCNWLIMEGALKRVRKKHSDALRILAQAEVIAHEQDNPMALFEIAYHRALTWKDLENPSAVQREAGTALQLAIEHGWAYRARQIRSEFHLSGHLSGVSTSRALSASHSATTVGPSSHGTSATIPSGVQKHLDALLQMSLASNSILEPDQQARVILKEIVKLLNAERAFLFLLEGANNTLVMKAGKDADGNDLTELGGYSATVVESARDNRKAIIVSGTEEGAVLGSESAVAYGLKSIMAAPLLVRDQLIGVVYLDNHLVKGIFTEDDVGILLALANHIAISIETSRNAQLEVEKKAFAKDLEVTGAVQALLLPENDSYRSTALEMAAYYQPAAQSGGDWWWYDKIEDDGILLLIGDITGHGAGAAMITAAVSSAYRAFRRSRGDMKIQTLLETLNEHLIAIAKSEYLMTMLAVEIQPRQGRVRCWGAGSPPMFILRSTGTVDVILSRGCPLGLSNQAFVVEECSSPIKEGDRIFIFTDGVHEIGKTNKRGLGLPGVRRLLSETRSMPVSEARTYLRDKLSAFRGGEMVEDDITFILTDVVRCA